MKIESNIPVEFWLQKPELLRWAREYLANPGAVPDYINIMLSDPYSFYLSPSATLIAPPPTIRYIRVHARYGAYPSFMTDSTHEIIEWLHSHKIRPMSNPPTLEDLLHGRNWNSPAQNNGNSPRIAYQGTRWASPFAPGTLGTYPIRTHAFPHTEAGRPSLAECFDGAIHLAEMHVMEAFRSRRAWQTMNPFGPKNWGAPPDDARVHIHSGELTGIRIFFSTADHKLFSIHNTYFWKPKAHSKGDVKEAGIFSFRDEKEALPYLYDYIRDARSVWTNLRKYSKSERQKDREQAREMEIRLPHLSQATSLILGTIKIWGDVVEHEFGYRAQYAKIASLDEGFLLHPDREAIPMDISNLQRIYSAPSRWKTLGQLNLEPTYEEPFTIDYDPSSMRHVYRPKRKR